MKDEIRICQVLDHGVWMDIIFDDIKKGQRYRMQEVATGECVHDDHGYVEFIAMSDPIPFMGTLAIDSQGVPECKI